VKDKPIVKAQFMRDKMTNAELEGQRQGELDDARHESFRDRQWAYPWNHGPRDGCDQPTENNAAEDVSFCDPDVCNQQSLSESTIGNGDEHEP
jgi:hypothetical protein